MVFKGKAGDAEEVSLMYRNAGEQALPAFGLLVCTGGSREAHIIPGGNKHFTLLPQEIQGWYSFGPLPRYPNCCNKPGLIW